jgi:DNA-binding HxlR family transcriptional regulator
MQRTPFSEQHCSVARTLDIIGEWWTLLILRDVFYGVRRFEALRTQLGISRKVLTQRLQRLTDEKILRRVAYQRHPPRYEYRLTPRGLDLMPVLLSIMRWGDRWLSEKGEAPVEFIHDDCGQVVLPKLVCAHCGGELTARNLHPRPGPGAAADEIRSMRAASANPKLFE